MKPTLQASPNPNLSTSTKQSKKPAILTSQISSTSSPSKAKSETPFPELTEEGAAVFGDLHTRMQKMKPMQAMDYLGHVLRVIQFHPGLVAEMEALQDIFFGWDNLHTRLVYNRDHDLDKQLDQDHACLANAIWAIIQDALTLETMHDLESLACILGGLADLLSHDPEMQEEVKLMWTFDFNSKVAAWDPTHGKN